MTGYLPSVIELGRSFVQPDYQSSYEEHDRVVEVCVAAVAGRVPVIAGAGSNSTREALRLTRHAKDVGADAALLITPYYNKPTQEGLFRHFAHVAERVDIPIVLYNVPGRTGVNLLPETVERLAAIANIVAIKEATADLRQASQIIERCGEKITVISGDDFTVLPMLAIGGRGVISVVSNVVPALMAKLYDSFVAGDLAAAREAHYRLFPLAEAMFIETNPLPVKTALALMGKITPEFRLPMCPMSEAHQQRLAGVLRAAGLLEG